MNDIMMYGLLSIGGIIGALVLGIIGRDLYKNHKNKYRPSQLDIHLNNVIKQFEKLYELKKYCLSKEPEFKWLTEFYKFPCISNSYIDDDYCLEINHGTNGSFPGSHKIILRNGIKITYGIDYYHTHGKEIYSKWITYNNRFITDDLEDKIVKQVATYFENLCKIKENIPEFIELKNYGPLQIKYAD